MLPLSIVKTARLIELQALEQEVKRLHQEAEAASAFIRQIGQGALDTPDNEPATGSTQRSELMASLLGMRGQMKIIADKDKQRGWATEGLAQFVEILRSSHENAEQLYDNILSSLVKYVSANQGGLFLVQPSEGESIRDTAIDLVACYAYDRKKYTEKRIFAGEGLVGQCFLEAATLHLTVIPEKYVHITSGLGEAPPCALLIVPLKLNDKVYGVLELASFGKFKPYEIEFIEKLGESIASAISTTQTNQRTRQLLEMSQAQAEQLGASEEEIRQNMEELEATQEEMRRKETEMTGLFTAINITLSTIEFSMDGTVTAVNDNFLKLMGYASLDEIRGKHHSVFVDPAYSKSDAYARFWQQLREGIPQTSDFMRITKTGQQVWLQASYTPVRDTDGRPYKVIKLAQDITDKKKAEIEAQKLSLVADNTDNAVIITGKNGLIEYVNIGFERMTGYSLPDVIGRKPGSFLQGPDTDPQVIERIREKLAAKKPFCEEILNYDKNGNTYWISLSINPVFDGEGNLDKFVAVQANITETKQKALEFNAKLEAIDKSSGMIEFDTKGNILSANSNFLALMGYTFDEVKGRHHRMFVDEREAASAEYADFWLGLGGRGEFVEGEFKRFNKAGHAVWLRGSYNAVLDLKGRPVKIIKIAQDISAQKLLATELQTYTEELRAQEEELRQNMEELMSIQEETDRKSIELNGLVTAVDSTLATIEFNMDGTILTANDNFLKMMDYTLDEIQGKHHCLFVDPDYGQSKEYVKFWEDLNRGKPQIGEVRRLMRSNQPVLLSASYTPVFDASKRPIKVIKFAQIVAAQHKNQELTPA